MNQNNQSPKQGSQFKYIDPKKHYSREEIRKMDPPTLLEYAELLDKRLYLVNLDLIKAEEKLTAAKKHELLGKFSHNYPESIQRQEIPDTTEVKPDPNTVKKPKTA